jgi:hypothetical protein
VLVERLRLDPQQSGLQEVLQHFLVYQVLVEVEVLDQVEQHPQVLLEVQVVAAVDTHLLQVVREILPQLVPLKEITEELVVVVRLVVAVEQLQLERVVLMVVVELVQELELIQVHALELVAQVPL